MESMSDVGTNPFFGRETQRICRNDFHFLFASDAGGLGGAAGEDGFSVDGADLGERMIIGADRHQWLLLL